MALFLFWAVKVYRFLLIIYRFTSIDEIIRSMICARHATKRIIRTENTIKSQSPERYKKKQFMSSTFVQYIFITSQYCLRHYKSNKRQCQMATDSSFPKSNKTNNSIWCDTWFVEHLPAYDILERSKNTFDFVVFKTWTWNG